MVRPPPLFGKELTTAELDDRAVQYSSQLRGRMPNHTHTSPEIIVQFGESSIVARR
jgi:hypothetical protein